jgi:hypothetical protein
MAGREVASSPWLRDYGAHVPVIHDRTRPGKIPLKNVARRRQMRLVRHTLRLAVVAGWLATPDIAFAQAVAALPDASSSPAVPNSGSVPTSTAPVSQTLPAASETDPSSPAPVVPSPAPAPPAAEKPSEPFAFGDFTWLNGGSRQHKSLLETEYFTASVLLDINYTASANNPIDNTVVGSTALSRNNELTLAFMGFGADFHAGGARGRLLTQYGIRSTLVPRNDGSTNRGQFDLQTALRYISEAYGGYHWDALHGINLDAGIFMSYVGLFSFDNYENWMYLPSFVSDNTPWFFNGIRLQMFPSETLKIEPWLINGWQTYGKFNELPGFGAQILYRPVEWLEVLTNDYVGWDTQDHPGQVRFHTDNSLEIRYFNDQDQKYFHRAAFSLTVDAGGEQGDGVTAFGGKSTNNTINSGATCTIASPCEQEFLGWMLYNRLWFFHDTFAWNIGGGMMHNPGRYLVLGPTGQASPFSQPLSIQGIEYTAASHPFSLNPGTTFDAYDYETGIQYMPNEQITYDLEFNHRQASVPYFAGHGGVTSPDGYSTTAVPGGWRPDLTKGDSRIIAAFLVRF